MSSYGGVALGPDVWNLRSEPVLEKLTRDGPGSRAFLFFYPLLQTLVCTTSERRQVEAVEHEDIREPGRSVDRDIGQGEKVEAELVAFIERRHEQRVKTKGERAVEDAWRESERRQEARRRADNLGGWAAHYRRLESFHAGRSRECGEMANELEGIGGTAA